MREYFAPLVFAAVLAFLVLFYHPPSPTNFKPVESPCNEAIALLSHAEERIYIAMYNFYYYPEFPDSCTNRIAEKVVENYEKGVDVKVFLDDKEENEKVIEFFKEAGVPVYVYDGPYILHAKVLFVDNCVLTGSSNFTYSGLFKNKEFDVLVCGELGDVLSWFESLEKECRRVS